MTRLLIAEAVPLIMLAMREALDTLTMPAVPVLIPDIVYFDAIRSAPPGSIVPWALTNGRLVRIMPTDAMTLRDANAAVGKILADKPTDRIVLLYNDFGLPRSENVVPITMHGYAQAVLHMQSADDLWDLVQRYAAPI